MGDIRRSHMVEPSRHVNTQETHDSYSTHLILPINKTLQVLSSVAFLFQFVFLLCRSRFSASLAKGPRSIVLIVRRRTRIP